MAFRRQDIPKTTRKGDDGEPRRLYPRFIRDRSLLPKVELAIGYLDGMVGRKRGDLSSDIVLELFGDPKLARCLLTCLAESYRYRTPEIAEVVGEEAALALAAWNLLTPADLRAHVYGAVNERLGGFVADGERDRFLADVAGPLGLDRHQLDDLLHLDAERNAILVRIGPRPNAPDVVARYNVVLVMSVLRHASDVTLELPGLDGTTLDTICGRHGVAWRRVAAETVRLAGRRGASGSWTSFGARVARCALQLIALCPHSPSGHATIHLGDQSLGFALDTKAVTPLRPKSRAVAGTDGVIRGAVLADEVATLRRKGGSHGWTLRRAGEPLVVDGALALPELLFTRGQTSVAVVPVPSGAGRASALAALELVGRARLVVAVGALPGSTAVPALEASDAAALVARLDEIVEGERPFATPLRLIEEELFASGWVPTSRIAELIGETDDLPARLQSLTVEGDATFVSGFGLCRLTLLEDLLDYATGGSLNVAALRSGVADRVGAGPSADALTLYLLTRHQLIALEAA